MRVGQEVQALPWCLLAPDGFDHTLNEFERDPHLRVPFFVSATVSRRLHSGKCARNVGQKRCSPPEPMCRGACVVQTNTTLRQEDCLRRLRGKPFLNAVVAKYLYNNGIDA